MKYSQILSIIALLSGSVNGYGQNLCRNFNPDKLVQNFNFDDFSGEWFPIYQSKNSAYVTGKCPVMSYQRLIGKYGSQQKRIQSLSYDREYYDLRTSYKGRSMIADNLERFTGYFDRGTSNGSLYRGTMLKPMKKFKDNFQVVSTDYDTYAIIYTCTARTAMYDKEVITVLSRISPALGLLPEDFENKVRSEFERVFGFVPQKQQPQVNEDKFLYPEVDQEQTMSQPESRQQEREVQPQLTKPEEIQSPEKVEIQNPERVEYQTPDRVEIQTPDRVEIQSPDNIEIQSPDNIQIDGNEAPQINIEPSEVKAGQNTRRQFQKRTKTQGKHLDFDNHLQLADHEGCTERSYPDLSVSMVERNKLQEQERRVQRQTKTPLEQEHQHIYPDGPQ